MTDVAQKGSSEALEIKDISVSFGGLKAVNNFSLSLKPKSLCGLIGPNGAGKTTVFNLITGVYVPDTGNLILGDKNLTGKKPFQIAKSGIARTFQNIRLLAELPVLDNVLVSYHMRVPYNLFDVVVQNNRFLKREQELKDKARDLLELMGLGKRLHDRAGSLSYGDQRRLEIARALATQPKVLLLDEPAAGLNSGEKVQLMNTVANIRDKFGVTILLIEHDMKLVMGICEHIIVLDHGETIATGTPEEIQKNPRVIEAYLGVA